MLGDDARLRQVVGNLTANALEHTPPGTAIHLSIAPAAPDVEQQPRWAITVRDEGPGIPPAEQDHVFERFSRGDPSRARTTGGAGLGFAIVAAIVEAHGGSVAPQNESPHGAAFTVQVPALRRAWPAEPGPTSHRAAAAASS